MRLIDADALIKYCDDNWIPLNVDAVNAQPTADVRENVHGKWIKPIRKMNGDRPDYECSACHNWFIWGDNIYLKFCPNCGADMRSQDA